MLLQGVTIDRRIVAVTRKAVEFVNDDSLKLALRRVGNHILKPFAVVGCSRSGFVDIDPQDRMPFAFRPFRNGANLRFDRVAVALGFGGITSISNDNHFTPSSES